MDFQENVLTLVIICCIFDKKRAMKEQIKELRKQFEKESGTFIVQNFMGYSWWLEEKLTTAPSVTDEEIIKHFDPLDKLSGDHSNETIVDSVIHGQIESKIEGAKWMRDNHLPSKGDECEWVRDEENCYDTSCGNVFQLMDGTPKENTFKYCLYCGGKITEQALKQKGGKDE